MRVCECCNRQFKATQYFWQHLRCNKRCLRHWRLHNGNTSAALEREEGRPDPLGTFDEGEEGINDPLPIPVPQEVAKSPQPAIGQACAAQSARASVPQSPPEERIGRTLLYGDVMTEFPEPESPSIFDNPFADLLEKPTDYYAAEEAELDREAAELDAECLEEGEFNEPGVPDTESGSPPSEPGGGVLDEDDGSTKLEAKVRQIRDGFREYCSYAKKHFIPMDPELAAATELMNLLNLHGISLNMYDKLFDWHIKHLAASQKVSSKDLLTRLRKRVNMEDTFAHEAVVELPSSGALARIPCFDFAVQLRDLLTDPRIKCEDYLFFNEDPLSPPPMQWSEVADINTGLSYRTTYVHRIAGNELTECGRRKVLCPVMFYQDGTVTGSLSNMSMELVKFTLGLFTYEAREKERCWRNLGAVPKLDSGALKKARSFITDSEHYEAIDYLSDDESPPGDAKSVRHTSNFDLTDYLTPGSEAPATPDTSEQDFHQMLQVILRSYQQIQDEGTPWDLHCKGKLHRLQLVMFVMFVKGDTVEHDRHCGKYLSRGKGVAQLCRYCTCPNQDTDEAYKDYPRKSPKMIKELVKKKDLAALKKLSQKYVFNAWYEIKFGRHNDYGIHGACPIEQLHWTCLGTLKHDRETFFSQCGKDSALGKSFNACATSVGWLFQRQSYRGFPRTRFSRGVLTGHMAAHEMGGVILVISVALRTTRGRDLLLNEARGEQRKFFPKLSWVKDWILLLETHLQFANWLRKKEMDVDLVQRLRTKAREMMEMCKTVGKRTQGMGTKTMNPHGMLHCAADILYFGVPCNFNTKSNESHHRPDKKSAKRTQFRPKTFDLQVCQKADDRRVIELAMEELNGRPRWLYYEGFQDCSSQYGSPNKPHERVRKGMTSSFGENATLRGVQSQFKWDADTKSLCYKNLTAMRNKGSYQFTEKIVAYLTNMHNKVKEWLNDDPLCVFSELKMANGQFHRASPHYQGKPWCDWALFTFQQRGHFATESKFTVKPAHIRCFVDLSFLPERNNSGYPRGICALVEPVRSNPDPSEAIGELTRPWIKCRHNKVSRMCLIPMANRLIGPACVIPDLDNKKASAWLEVKPLEEWDTLFELWLNDSHVRAFNEPQEVC